VTDRLATPAEERELARVRGKFQLTEKEWQAQLVELARLYGWRCYHTLRSQGSEAGFPDLVLVRPPQLVFAELKTDKGRLSPAQKEWLADLEQVSAGAIDVAADVWRPADFDRVHAILRREAA
jgi:VRR-NUC domain